MVSRNACARDDKTNCDDTVQDSQQSLGQFLGEILKKEETRVLECQHGRYYEETTLRPMDLLCVTRNRNQVYVSEKHNKLTNQHHDVQEGNHYGSEKTDARRRRVGVLWVDLIKEKLAAP